MQNSVKTENHNKHWIIFNTVPSHSNLKAFPIVVMIFGMVHLLLCRNKSQEQRYHNEVLLYTLNELKTILVGFFPLNGLDVC